MSNQQSLSRVSELLVAAGETRHLSEQEWQILEHRAALMEDEAEDAASQSRIKRAAMLAGGTAAAGAGAYFGGAAAGRAAHGLANRLDPERTSAQIRQGVAGASGMAGSAAQGLRRAGNMAAGFRPGVNRAAAALPGQAVNLAARGREAASMALSRLRK